MFQLPQFVWALRSSVWDVFINFLLIDAADRSKISGDQKRFFIALSLYPLSFFANTPFKIFCLKCLHYLVCLLATSSHDIVQIYLKYTFAQSILCKKGCQTLEKKIYCKYVLFIVSKEQEMYVVHLYIIIIIIVIIIIIFCRIIRDRDVRY